MQISGRYSNQGYLHGIVFLNVINLIFSIHLISALSMFLQITAIFFIYGKYLQFYRVKSVVLYFIFILGTV